MPWVEVEVQVPTSVAPVDTLRRVIALDGNRHLQVPLRLLQWGVSRPDWLTVVGRDR